MKSNRNQKQRIAYFQKTDALKHTGIGLVGLGVLLYFFGWGYLSYVLSGIALPIGGVLFLIGSAGRATDRDLDEQIERSTAELASALEEQPAVKKRLLKQQQPETVEGYAYREGVMLKKTKDGALRSSEYTKSILCPLIDGVYILSRSLSLITDEVHDTTLELSYAQIVDIRLEQQETSIPFGKRTFRARDTRLVIEHDGGTLSLPAKDNASLDALIETVRRMMRESGQ